MENYSINEVASMLRLTIKSVRRYVAAGELSAHKKGSTYHISEEALTSFRQRIFSEDKIEGYDLFGAPVYKEPPKIEKCFKIQEPPDWIDVSPYWNAPGKSAMTFVDLFCGAGGLSKGLESAGLEGICGLDWFYEAGMTYERNFDHPFINGDIKQPETKKRFYDAVLQKLAGRKLSLVAGGFPCQGFSMAGNRIVDDPRNSLYLELLEIVRKLKPDFVLCENVKGLRSMLHGKVERQILADFRAIGYNMKAATLCAADYCTPQKRERVIFIGNRLNAPIYYPKPLLTPEQYVTTGEAIADLMVHPADPAFNHEPTRHSVAMIEKMKLLPEGQSLYKGYSDAWKRCPWNEPSCTIKENHGGVNVHPKLPRVLTAREMARLQSFPDDFIFMGGKAKQLVQIGNAVPPYLGKAIGLAIRSANGDLKQGKAK